MNPIIVIPARLASTRLPGKALADLGSLPMVVRVARQAVAAQVAPVLVAAGDRAIMEACEAFGVHAVLTSPELPSGADRVHAALNIVDPKGIHDVAINLQGDLPLIAPATIADVLRPLTAEFDLATLVAPITSDAEAQASSVVKAVCDFGNATIARALYFSRAVAPWGAGPLWHHVGIYAWRRAALDRFVQAPQSGLEQRESLEQLRALEMGMSIGVCAIDHAPLGVDTPHDLARVRAMLE